MPSSLKLSEFNDDELIHVLDAVANDEGWATTQDVAAEIGLTHDNPNNCVGGRFAYLKRIKVLQNKQDKGETWWKLTAKGKALTHPRKLPVAVERALEDMDEGQQIAATNRLARRVPRSSAPGGQLTKRAWRHHTMPSPA